MKRSILGFLAGLVTWIVVVSVIDRILRQTMHDYTAAERAIRFTPAMKFARLAMAAVTSLAAGAVARRISHSNRWVPMIVGGVVLAVFLPFHIAIWSKLPAWYHLTFLLTIIPFVWLGAQLSPPRD